MRIRGHIKWHKECLEILKWFKMLSCSKDMDCVLSFLLCLFIHHWYVSTVIIFWWSLGNNAANIPAFSDLHWLPWGRSLNEGDIFNLLFLLASGDLHSHHNSIFLWNPSKIHLETVRVQQRKTITDAIAFLNYCYKLFKNEEINEFFKSMALIEKKKKKRIHCFPNGNMKFWT